MRIHEQDTTSARSVRRSRVTRAGVIYVEQLLMLIAGLCIAMLLAAFAREVLRPRYARIAGALLSSAP